MPFQTHNPNTHDNTPGASWTGPAQLTQLARTSEIHSASPGRIKVSNGPTGKTLQFTEREPVTVTYIAPTDSRSLSGTDAEYVIDVSANVAGYLCEGSIQVKVPSGTALAYGFMHLLANNAAVFTSHLGDVWFAAPVQGALTPAIVGADTDNDVYRLSAGWLSTSGVDCYVPVALLQLGNLTSPGQQITYAPGPHNRTGYAVAQGYRYRGDYSQLDFTSQAGETTSPFCTIAQTAPTGVQQCNVAITVRGPFRWQGSTPYGRPELSTVYITTNGVHTVAAVFSYNSTTYTIELDPTAPYGGSLHPLCRIDIQGGKIVSFDDFAAAGRLDPAGENRQLDITTSLGLPASMFFVDGRLSHTKVPPVPLVLPVSGTMTITSETGEPPAVTTRTYTMQFRRGILIAASASDGGWVVDDDSSSSQSTSSSFSESSDSSSPSSSSPSTSESTAGITSQSSGGVTSQSSAGLTSQSSESSITSVSTSDGISSSSTSLGTSTSVSSGPTSQSLTSESSTTETTDSESLTSESSLSSLSSTGVTTASNTSLSSGETSESSGVTTQTTTSDISSTTATSESSGPTSVSQSSQSSGVTSESSGPTSPSSTSEETSESSTTNSSGLTSYSQTSLSSGPSSSDSSESSTS